MILWIVPEIEKKWTQPIIHNWGLIINQFMLIFGQFPFTQNFGQSPWI